MITIIPDATEVYHDQVGSQFVTHICRADGSTASFKHVTEIISPYTQKKETVG